MPRYFTLYWRNEDCNFKDEQLVNNSGLNHIAGSRFLRRGLKPGDFAYVVTVRQGELRLIGKMEIGEIVDLYEAAAILNLGPDKIWHAPEHLVASASTALLDNLYVPFGVTLKLRFKSGSSGELVGLKFRSPGYLDSQTLRSIRELTTESAADLDRVLDEKGCLETRHYNSSNNLT